MVPGQHPLYWYLVRYRISAGFIRLLYCGVSSPSRTESSLLTQLWSLQQPTAQVPITSANTDCNLGHGLWSTMRGLRPGHFIGSCWRASGDWAAQPVFSGGDWELCVLIPAAWGCWLPSRCVGSLLVEGPVWMLLGFSQGSRGKS